MEDFFEEYGGTLIAAMIGTIMLGITFILLSDGSILSNWTTNFSNSIIGG